MSVDGGVATAVGNGRVSAGQLAVVPAPWISLAPSGPSILQKATSPRAVMWLRLIVSGESVRALRGVLSFDGVSITVTGFESVDAAAAAANDAIGPALATIWADADNVKFPKI